MNKINFVDGVINKLNGKHDFEIFRSHKDITIRTSSVHPYQHRLATFHCMIHTLILIEKSQKTSRSYSNYQTK